MDITTLLNTFKEKLGPHPASTSRATEALHFVFKDRAFLYTAQPSRNDTTAFITLLTLAVRGEQKANSDRRGDALDKILCYNGNPGNSAFIGIKPEVFAFQLACRVREPSLINQIDTGFCGVNAMMIAFAHDDPVGFVEYAISLMQNGRGMFRQLKVKADDSILKGHNSGTMVAADVVTLASLGFQFWQRVRSHTQGTTGATPTELCHWLQTARLNCADNTNGVEKLKPDQRMKNLREAANSVIGDRTVILTINDDLINNFLLPKKKLQKGLVTTPPPRLQDNSKHTNHWVLVKRLTINTTFVDIKFYSHGLTYIDQMPHDKFLSYYGGHISAWP